MDILKFIPLILKLLLSLSILIVVIIKGYNFYRRHLRLKHIHALILAGTPSRCIIDYMGWIQIVRTNNDIDAPPEHTSYIFSKRAKKAFKLSHTTQNEVQLNRWIESQRKLLIDKQENPAH